MLCFLQGFSTSTLELCHSSFVSTCSSSSSRHHRSDDKLSCKDVNSVCTRLLSELCVTEFLYSWSLPRLDERSSVGHQKGPCSCRYVMCDFILHWFAPVSAHLLSCRIMCIYLLCIVHFISLLSLCCVLSSHCLTFCFPCKLLLRHYCMFFAFFDIGFLLYNSPPPLPTPNQYLFHFLGGGGCKFTTI